MLIFVALSNLLVALSAVVFMCNGWNGNGVPAMFGGALLGTGAVWAAIGAWHVWKDCA
jgi:hypothetical protein